MHIGLSIGLTGQQPLSLLARAISAIRRNNGTLIYVPDNALGDGAPNLLSAPEFAAGLTDAPVRGGPVTVTGLAGYDNALALGPDAYAYKQHVFNASASYTFSVLVKMDDGNAPIFSNIGGVTSAGNTFALVIRSNATTPSLNVVTDLGGGLFRVSCTDSGAGSGAQNVGIVKYSTNDSRTFKVTGYKLELGSVATAYTPQSVLRTRGTFIDSTGTQPVSAVGDVLGLLTDRSYGASNLGPELFTGAYATGASTTATYNGNEATATFGGQILATSSNWLSIPGATAANGMTVVEFWATWVSGGGLEVGRAWHVGQIITAASNGGVRKKYSAQAFSTWAVPTQGRVTFGATTAGSVWKIEIISVREVLGNHATQPTTANKPVIARVPKRLGPNLVVNGTFDANLTGWTKLDTAPSVTEWVSGKARMTAAAGSALARLRQQVPVVADKTYQVSVSVVTITGTPGAALVLGNASSGDNTYGSILLPTAGRFSREVTPAGSIIGLAFYAGNADGGTITLDDVEVREVLEWTNVISFDGSNDFLQTGITTGNEGWVCAGVTLASGVPANQSIFYSGADADSTAGAWLAVSGGSVRFGVGNGTTRNTIFATTVPVGSPQVIEGGWDASLVRAALNGVETAQAKTVNCTTSRTFRIGLTDASWPFGGPMTAFVYTPVLPSAADRALIRRWIGSLQGQTL